MYIMCLVMMLISYIQNMERAQKGRLSLWEAAIKQSAQLPVFTVDPGKGNFQFSRYEFWTMREKEGGGNNISPRQRLGVYYYELAPL